MYKIGPILHLKVSTHELVERIV